MMQRQKIESLEMQDVHFGYEGATAIFEGLSFQMPNARGIWIRSPGGRGKSTLLKILAGLVMPTQGKYLINNQNIAELSFEEFLSYRLSFGYGFDLGGLINNMTLFDNLALPLRYHKMMDEEEIHSRIDQILEHFGLTPSRNLRPFAMSGSQRKLVCVVRAFIHWPQVVILDDVLTGLKEDNINDLIYFLNEGFATRGLKQVIFTSESPFLANQLKADELLIASDWVTTRAVA